MLLCEFFSTKVPEFLHVVFSLMEIMLKEIMLKNLSFPVASFGDLLLHKKQKKYFVLLNNEICKACHINC